MRLNPRRCLAIAALPLLVAGCMSSVPLAERDPIAAAYIAEHRDTASAALAPVADAFTSQTVEWQDTARNRAVPVRVYAPAGAAANANDALPLIVFSHGLGGSREGYRYLGRHFAANGYIAVHVQHVGSDRQVWMGNPLGLLSRLSGAAQETEALDRVADVRFVLDQLLVGEWGSRIDAQRILVAGHSYGANTAMLVSGAKVEKEGRALALADPRVRAAILISAPPFYGMRDSKAILQDIAIPTLHITSTDDDITIPGYRSGIGDRIDVFQATAGKSRAPKLLAVFKGGAHSMFTDRLGPGGQDLNPIVKTATRDLALQFANRVLNLAPAQIAEWPKRHAPLVARFEQVGEMLR